MRNFPGIVFIWTRTYTEIFKSAKVHLVVIAVFHDIYYYYVNVKPLLWFDHVIYHTVRNRV